MSTLTIQVYKGEGRILILPVIGCRTSNWFVNLPDTEGCFEVGKAVLNAVDFIKENMYTRSMEEKDAIAVWEKNTKYKNWISFWKNNFFARITVSEEGSYNIYSLKRSEKRRGSYTECIKDIYLSPEAETEKIGHAVIDVLEASENFYKHYNESKSWLKKIVEIPNGSHLTVCQPKDTHFEDCDDCGAGEIYQCYEYHTREGAESCAEFYVGMAAELDCSLEEANVAQAWEDIYHKADFFEMQEVNHGIFNIRVEMRNKEYHKISYFLQMSEDLLLECAMQVHQPGKRKKADEKLESLFDDFSMNCVF